MSSLISEKFSSCEGREGEANTAPLLHDVCDGKAKVYTKEGANGFLAFHDSDPALTVSPSLREGASGDVKRSFHAPIIPYYTPHASTKWENFLF